MSCSSGDIATSLCRNADRSRSSGVASLADTSISPRSNAGTSVDDVCSRSAALLIRMITACASPADVAASNIAANSCVDSSPTRDAVVGASVEPTARNVAESSRLRR